MILGPLRFVIPNRGKKTVILSSLTSGNTFRAIRWTDGKMDAPMLPAQPWLMRSPCENLLFWRDECTEVAEVYVYEGERIPSELKDAVQAEDPEKCDYYRAMEEGLCNKEDKLIYLRRMIWWADNDPYRYGKTDAVPVHDKRNLEQLLAFLRVQIPENLVCAAEINRELHRFKECLKLLEQDMPESFMPYVRLIKERALAEDPAVARLPSTRGRDI